MNDEKRPRPTSRTSSKGSEAASDYSDAMEGQSPQPTQKPSQAEGDRETVEQSIREHEENGELF
jgi:hypothetical protein